MSKRIIRRLSLMIAIWKTIWLRIAVAETVTFARSNVRKRICSIQFAGTAKHCSNAPTIVIFDKDDKVTAGSVTTDANTQIVKDAVSDLAGWRMVSSSDTGGKDGSISAAG